MEKGPRKVIESKDKKVTQAVGRESLMKFWIDQQFKMFQVVKFLRSDHTLKLGAG